MRWIYPPLVGLLIACTEPLGTLQMPIAPDSGNETAVTSDAEFPDATVAASWSRDTNCPEGPCANYGQCQFSGPGNPCIAKTNADCQQAAWCKGPGSHGACMSAAGACVQGPDNSACAGASICATQGNCAFLNGLCAPGSQADCQAADICKDNARCTFAQGECIPQTDADCSGSTLCKKSGACHFVKGFDTSSQGNAKYDGSCHASSAADCQQSSGCKEKGLCTYYPKSGVCLK